MENLQPDVPPLTREPFFVAAKQGDHFGRRFFSPVFLGKGDQLSSSSVIVVGGYP